MTTDTKTRELFASGWLGGKEIEGTRRRLLITPEAWEDAQRKDYEAGADAYDPPFMWLTVQDFELEEVIQIAVAPCDAACRCDAAWRPVTTNSKWLPSEHGV